jgi:hypothetical protein
MTAACIAVLAFLVAGNPTVVSAAVGNVAAFTSFGVDRTAIDPGQYNLYDQDNWGKLCICQCRRGICTCRKASK